MAFEFNDLKGFLFLVLMTIPLTATTNINCKGKPFHCVNSTHFMICVDLGSGVSSTIDDFIIPCPPATVCQPNNNFECEFPEELPPPLDVIGVSTTSNISTLPPPVNSLTTPTQTEQIIALPKEKQNLTTFKNVTSPKFSETLENLKEEFTGGNESVFHVTETLPSSTISPIDNKDGITTVKYDANEKTTDKLLNSRTTESAPPYGIEANVTDNSQTLTNVRTFEPTPMIIKEIPSTTKEQIESSTALPSMKEPLPKENTTSESLNKEHLGDDKRRKTILSPSNVVSSITNLNETIVIANNATNKPHTTNSSYHESVYVIESNSSDNSQTLLDAEAFDAMFNNVPNINQSTTKIFIESSTTLPITEQKIPTSEKLSPPLFGNVTTEEQIGPSTVVPIVNHNLTPLVGTPSPKLQVILEDLKDEFTGGNETFFHATETVPSSTTSPIDNMDGITTVKYDANEKATDKSLNSRTTESAPPFGIEANVNDNSQTLPNVRTFDPTPMIIKEIQSTTKEQIESNSALPSTKEPLPKENTMAESLKYDANEKTTDKLLTSRAAESAPLYSIEANVTDKSQTLLKVNTFGPTPMIIEEIQSTTKEQIESSSALPSLKETSPKENTTSESLNKEHLGDDKHRKTILSPSNVVSSITNLSETIVISNNATNKQHTTNSSYHESVYAIKSNSSDNTQTLLDAKAFDFMVNNIPNINQSTTKILIESSTALPITEQKIPTSEKLSPPLFGNVTTEEQIGPTTVVPIANHNLTTFVDMPSPKVQDILEDLKDEFTGGNETFFHATETAPSSTTSPIDNMDGSTTIKYDANEKTTDKLLNSRTTESAPPYGIEANVTDNSQNLTNVRTFEPTPMIIKEIPNTTKEQIESSTALPSMKEPLPKENTMSESLKYDANERTTDKLLNSRTKETPLYGIEANVTDKLQTLPNLDTFDPTPTKIKETPRTTKEHIESSTALPSKKEPLPKENTMSKSLKYDANEKTTDKLLNSRAAESAPLYGIEANVTDKSQILPNVRTFNTTPMKIEEIPSTSIEQNESSSALPSMKEPLPKENTTSESLNKEHLGDDKHRKTILSPSNVVSSITNLSKTIVIANDATNKQHTTNSSYHESVYAIESNSSDNTQTLLDAKAFDFMVNNIPNINQSTTKIFIASSTALPITEQKIPTSEKLSPFLFGNVTTEEQIGPTTVVPIVNHNFTALVDMPSPKLQEILEDLKDEFTGGNETFFHATETVPSSTKSPIDNMDGITTVTYDENEKTTDKSLNSRITESAPLYGIEAIVTDKSQTLPNVRTFDPTPMMIKEIQSTPKEQIESSTALPSMKEHLPKENTMSESLKYDANEKNSDKLLNSRAAESAPLYGIEANVTDKSQILPNVRTFDTTPMKIEEIPSTSKEQIESSSALPSMKEPLPKENTTSESLNKEHLGDNKHRKTILSPSNVVSSITNLSETIVIANNATNKQHTTNSSYHESVHAIISNSSDNTQTLLDAKAFDFMVNNIPNINQSTTKIFIASSTALPITEQKIPTSEKLSPFLFGNVTTEEQIGPTTVVPIVNHNLTTLVDMPSPKLQEILEDLKDEFTGGNETFFHATETVPSSTKSPIDNMDGITTVTYDANEKTTDKSLNSRITESAPLYGIEAIVTDKSQTLPNVRTFDPTPMIIKEIQSTPKEQIESSTALPSMKEHLPKENTMSESLKYDANEKNSDKLLNSRAAESAPLYGIEANVTDKSQILPNVRTFDTTPMKIEEIPSTSKEQIESSSALPSMKEPLPKENTTSESLNKEHLGDNKHRKTILSPSNVVSSITNLSETIVIANNATNKQHTTNSSYHESVHAIISNSSDNTQTLLDAKAFDFMVNNIPNINQSTTKIFIASSTALPITEQKIPTSEKLSPFLFGNVTTEEQIGPTTVVPIVNHNLTTLVDMPSPKLQEILEDLKDEFTGGNETFFHATETVPSSTKSPIDNMDGITTVTYDANEKTTDKSLNSRITESAPLYGIEAIVTDKSQTLPNVRTFDPTPMIIKEIQSTPKEQIESSTALPSMKEHLPKENTMSESLKYDANEKNSDKLLNSRAAESAPLYGIEANVTDKSQTLPNVRTFDPTPMKIKETPRTTKEQIESSTALPSTKEPLPKKNTTSESLNKEYLGDDKRRKTILSPSNVVSSTTNLRETIVISNNATNKEHTSNSSNDLMLNNTPKINRSTTKILIESSTALPITEQKIPTFPSPKPQEILEELKDEVTGGNETYFQKTTAVPRSTASPSDTLNYITTTKYDKNEIVTNAILHSTESASTYKIEANLTDNSQITATLRPLTMISTQNAETQSDTKGQQVPLPRIENISAKLKEQYIGRNETFYQKTSVSPDDIEISTNVTNENRTNNLSNPQSIINSASDSSQTLPNAFELMLNNVININQSNTKVSNESSTALPITKQNISNIKERSAFAITDSVTAKQISSTAATPILKQNLSTLADLTSPKQSEILKTLQEHKTTPLPRLIIKATDLNETTTKNNDMKVKNTDSNVQSAPETAHLYRIEANVTENSQNSQVTGESDLIHHYITMTNQSFVKIPMEPITASSIPEEKLQTLKEVTSQEVIGILGSLKGEYTHRNETFIDVLTTLPGDATNSSENRTAKNYTNEDTNNSRISHSATEPAPLYVIDVTASDNSQTTDMPALKPLNTISKNIMSINETTDHSKTAFQLQGNNNLLAIMTTSRPANNSEQNSILSPAAQYNTSNTVVEDNLIPINIVSNISNLNEKIIKENKPETTTNYIEPNRLVNNPPITNIKATLLPQHQIAHNMETSEKLSDHAQISGKQPFVGEKAHIKGLDAKHMASNTNTPINFEKTVYVESQFSVPATSTPPAADIDLHMNKRTTLQSVNFKNDKVSEPASTIPVSYTIYETTPNPLHDNKNINSLKGVTETMSTLVNHSPDIIYDPELQTVTPIPEVDFRKDYITSKPIHLLSAATYSSVPPTAETETVQAYTPQYTILKNEATQNLSKNDKMVEKISSPAFATEQRHSSTLELEQVQSSIHTSSKPSYTKPIGLSNHKVTEAPNSSTNSYTDTGSRGIEMSHNKMAFPKAVTSDRMNTKDEINSTILTPKANNATDIIKNKDNKNDELAVDITKPVISGDLKIDSIPKENTVVPTIVSNTNITDYNLKTTSVPPIQEVSITKANTNGVIYTDQHSVITDHNLKNDNILITSIKPVTAISILNAADNPLGIERAMVKPDNKNTLVRKTQFTTRSNTLNTSGNEVLTTTEAYINHPKGEIIRKDNEINSEKISSLATKGEVNHNVSIPFIAEKSMHIPLIVNKTQIINEDVHSTEKSFQMTVDKIRQKSNVPSQVRAIFVTTTENPDISVGFDKLVKTRAESVRTPSTTENIEYSKHSTKTITNSVNKQTSIKENMTNPSNINNITLVDIIVMNKTGSVSYLRNMNHANTTAEKETLQKDTHSMSLNSKRAINLSNREEITLGRGSDSLSENPINIELSIDKKSNYFSHKNNYELSTSYFEVTSYIDVTTPNPLVTKETSFNTGKHTKGTKTEINNSPDNLYQQQNITHGKKLLSNVQVNKISNKEENHINYEQKNTTSNANNINASSEANINKTASLYDCWNNTRGKYADRNDCRKFYICFGKLQPIVGTCPENTVFSEINKQCTRNLSHCVRNNQFHCLYEGRFSDMLKDNTYYICVKHNSNFLRYKLQCQNGYHLNKATVKCEKNYEKLSQSTSSSVSENSKINDQNGLTGKTQSSEQLVTSEKLEKPEKQKNSQNKKDFECKKEGKFQYPRDCTKYYVCYKNKKNEYRRKIKRCSDDKVYNKEKEKCVSAESDEC